MYLVLLGLVAILLIYWKVFKPLNYWTERGVLQGNKYLFMKKFGFAELVDYIYNEFPNEKFSGTYIGLKPTLIIREPDIIKQITIKDFEHFSDHAIVLPDECEPLFTSNLVSLRGEKWHHMRATLSPAFTSSKMRAMFTLMNDCAKEFTIYFHEKSKSETIIDEMKDVFTRCTNDIIATCAFGVKCDSLKDRKNEFYLMGKEATDFKAFEKMIKYAIVLKSPFLIKLLGIRLFSDKVGNFFRNLVTNTMKIREEQHIIRPDMIHLLMEAQKGRLHYEESDVIKETGFATVEESHIGKVAQNPDNIITDEMITAQALIFFVAGFDGVATLMSFMAYEIAINPDIQDRLRCEIDDVNEACNGKLTYETINKMKYLDMVISETLRKWPISPLLERICTKSYKFQRENQGPLEILKGSHVWIPVWGIHHNPKYYPNPDKFDPERFNETNKSNILPYTYLPFGQGPRNCIGSRFALLEAKTVIFYLLSKFEFVPVEKTPIPLKLVKEGITMNAVGGFWLGFKPRK